MSATQVLNPPQPPPVFTHTADSILSDTKKLNDQYKKLLDETVAAVGVENATFSSTLEPTLFEDNDTSAARRIISFYQHVSPHDDLRKASTESEELTSDFNVECSMREDVFKLVEAAYQQRGSENVDPESLRILEKERQKYIRNGLLLQGAERDRFMEIQKRKNLLCIQGQKNLNEEKGGIWFTPEELDGVPSDDISIDTLEKGEGENQGKVKLTFKYNHFIPLMKYAKNADTRRRYVVADANKCNNNVPLFHEIIELRDEAARLLGYDNHASVRIEPKMAKSATKVNEFLGDLRSRLVEGGAQEQARLLEYKKKDYEERGLEFDGNFYMWDSSYYSRIQKEKEYSVDEATVSQYFPAYPTFSGMLKIFEEIFGLAFVEIKGEDRAKLSPTGKAEDIVWHDDVRLFTVWNDEASGSGFVGYLYIDLHPRDNKYGHNANFGLEPGYLKRDGKRNYPATALVCNFSKPTATKPALLKHDEVVTLFHELGHGIHDLVAQTKWSYFHGTSTVVDFVEAPSQMLENWCWTGSVLKSLSGHWETGKPIPDDLLEKLMETKNFNQATANLGQLFFGTFDMKIHTPESHEAVKNMDVTTLWNTLRTEITGVKGPEALGEGYKWGNRFANIGHYIGGYDAGYYGYLWSQVFSADMFHSFFKKNPMDAKAGRRYRELVLGRGGSKDEMEMLTEFLGRPPSTESFYKELGLA